MSITTLTTAPEKTFPGNTPSHHAEVFSPALMSTHATRQSSLSYLSNCMKRLGSFASPQLHRIYEEGRKIVCEGDIQGIRQSAFDGSWIRSVEEELSGCAQTLAKTIALSRNAIGQVSKFDNTNTIRKNLGSLVERAIRRGHASDNRVSLGDRTKFKMSVHFMEGSSVQIEWQHPFFIGFKKRISRVFHLQEGGDTVVKAYAKAIKAGIAPERHQAYQFSLEKEAAVSSLLHSEDSSAAMPGEKYLLKIKKVFHKKDPALFKGIVMEYCQSHDIGTLPEPSPQDKKIRVNIAYQLALALSAMHAKDICHLDVKPENVFLLRDERGELCVRLGDFEFCEKTKTINPKMKGTFIFLPPEAFTPQGRWPALPSVDMWSFGLTLLELTHGITSNPFATSTQIQPDIFSQVPFVIQKTWRALHTQIIESLNKTDPIDQLIRDLLNFDDPSSRPSAQEAADRLFALVSA